MKNLREEIERITSDNNRVRLHDEGKESVEDQLISLFKQQMLKIVGEDESESIIAIGYFGETGAGMIHQAGIRKERNNLRHQLRQEVEKL